MRKHVQIIVVFIFLSFLNACNQHKQKNHIKSDKQVMPIQQDESIKKPPQISSAQIKDKTDLYQHPIQTTQANAMVKEIEKVKPDIQIAVKKEKTKIVKTQIDSYNVTEVIRLDSQAVKDKELKLTETVIYFQQTGYDNKHPQLKNHIISSQNKRFVPSVLAIQKGSQVTFPNLDRILHNVFSVSKKQEFDLGLYSSGKQKTVTFDTEGVIYVHCNVHHSMQADLLVLDTPWYTNADSQGRFNLDDIPNIPGYLYFWHPRATLIKIPVNDLSKAPHYKQTIAIVREKIPKHLNKFGSSYRPQRRK